MIFSTVCTSNIRQFAWSFWKKRIIIREAYVSEADKFAVLKPLQRGLIMAAITCINSELVGSTSTWGPFYFCE